MFKAENISKSYKNKMILNTISFELKDGSALGILGSNGSGKTTLLSILSGVQSTDAGDFFYNGSSLFNDAALRQAIIGYVPQLNPLIEELSGYDNLLLWYNKSDLDMMKNTTLFKALNVEEFYHKKILKMSEGMKKRIAIACSMANKPRLLLLDEPTAALDIIGKNNIFKFLNEFKENGGSVILVSHDLNELSFCDSHYILKNGSLTSWHYNNDINAVIEFL